MGEIIHDLKPRCLPKGSGVEVGEDQLGEKVIPYAHLPYPLSLLPGGSYLF